MRKALIFLMGREAFGEMWGMFLDLIKPGVYALAHNPSTHDATMLFIDTFMYCAPVLKWTPLGLLLGWR